MCASPPHSANQTEVSVARHDLTVHAIEEMAEDDLDVWDIEQAVMNGKVVRRSKRDRRGIKYTIEGLAVDGERMVGVVGRFHATDRFLIITVYDLNKYH